MKNFFLACLLATGTLSSPLMAQSSDTQNKATAQSNTGIGFVISSALGGRLKSGDLYYQDGKTYKKITTTGRTVSNRVRIRGEQLKLWDSDPTPASPDAKPVPPLGVINIPDGSGSRPVCLVLPYKDTDGKTKIRGMVLSSSLIPSSGQHILNLSPYPLTLLIATKSDFSDRKEFKIAPNRQGGRSLQSDNTYSLKGGEGAVRSFMLSATLQSGRPAVRLRASRFVLSSKQGQATIIFKDPTRVGVKMESIVVPAPVQAQGRR